MTHCNDCQTALTPSAMLLSNQGQAICKDCFNDQKMTTQVAGALESKQKVGVVFALLACAFAVMRLVLTLS